jgi:hypothetical protein
MNQGLEKSLNYSHERQQAELLLTLNRELDNFLQTEAQVIPKKELHNLSMRTKAQIEEKYENYPKNPPAPKRIQAIKQAEISLRLDEEMNGLRTRVKSQKDAKHQRLGVRTPSFYVTPPAAQGALRHQDTISRERSWSIKAQAWKQGSAK